MSWFRRREEPPREVMARLADVEVAVKKLGRLVDDLDANLAAWKKREGKREANAARTVAGDPAGPTVDAPALGSRLKHWRALRRGLSQVSPPGVDGGSTP